MKAKKLGCGCLVIFLAFLGIVFFMGLLISSASEKRAQEELNYRQAYIAETEKLAVRVAKKYDLLPSVMIAQSILESNWGRSELSQEYNNYFGIKAVKKDDGIAFETEEYVEGQ
ncbi:MAG: glucosaminidase domain-containing protein, partial [Peptoniphilus harei]|nr:glucosaminidase domain-containing protein [Peptoniphilus harei]